ncbi:probable pectinesterase/pectinesterase inhibitor 12 [Punica granatum]|uniref:Pectinesterase n=2 Tax=Punica granatum TaxID=22663 RepID=A0A218WNN1_PUNGR|nr:probable pectinesterase/pectinesterase inhibitor 12 [Punica granatum]OWM74395.1 hypothetical protein CDL15_Pgr013299 [Punica granatum]PKI73646.1 hypothetical protein CRG98_005887 [Punica granatum]
MASTLNIVRSIFLVSAILLSTTNALADTSSTSNSLNAHLAAIKSICKETPYPDLCIESLKLSISINITPNILTFLLHTLEAAISEATKLNTLLFDIFLGHSKLNIIEHQKGTLQDCKDLHQVTVSSLQRSVSQSWLGDSRKLPNAWAYLSAALTNKATCLEELSSASGPAKPILVNSVLSTYKHVSNSLAILAGQVAKKPSRAGRKLTSFPEWVSENARRVLEDDEYDPSEVITVAADGTGNFTRVSDAINFAPNNSYDRTIIYVKEGVYTENVEIPSYKMNIVLLGDGADVTVITGNRSVADGWTTFRSATVAVSGEGFLARDIAFENTAGPAKHQAVALRVNADFSAFYRCSMSAYQDTLYVHSFRQFYRECDISGTIDYIFGNAAAVFQGCNIISRMPMPGQFTVITAQSRETPDQNTGISIQNCSILAMEDLVSNSGSVNSYLGRPWRNYSRTVVMESYIDGFIDPSGWTRWSGDEGLDTLYYGEYENYGPGSSADNRVTWPGYHVLDYYEAYNFTVSEFITSEEWLESTSFPYDDGI